MMKCVLAIALVAYASALPASPDSTVPEVMLTQAMSTAAKAAKETVSKMLETGSSDSACAELATATLNTVTESVHELQETVNAFSAPNDGSACLTEGQDGVDAATTALDDARTASTDAASAAATAAGAGVNFGPIVFSSLHDSATGGACGPWIHDAAYVSAKAAAEAAAAHASEAAAAIAGFEAALTSAEAAAAKAVKVCECHVYSTYTAAYSAAASHSADHEASWTKGKHMQCVLAGTSPADCDTGSVPTVTPITLAAGATESACHEAALDCDHPTDCATEGGHCSFEGTKMVRYGQDGHTFTTAQTFTNGVDCNNAAFGDPLPGVGKKCQICTPPTYSADSDGDFKIEGGGDSGRLMFYHEGHWGTVCDDYFDSNNNGANVVCKAMGYSGGVNINYCEDTGGCPEDGSLPIWLDDITCSGSEATLTDCANTRYMTHNEGCAHSEDVGVTCH